MHVEHRNTRYAKHVCPDCDAGLVWTTSAKSEPKPVWTAEQERAAVVAWLRGAHDHERNYHRAEAVWDAAYLIEQGAHLTETE
jgi:ferric-dicitrate binding protein FerR (iron transport regulator)